MLTALFWLIVVLEVIRMAIYIRDSRAVARTNKKVQEHQAKLIEFEKQHEENWIQLRKAEIAELKELAKCSDTMKEIYDEWVKEHKVGE